MTAYERLARLAADLWWTWQPGAAELFEGLDPALWSAVGHRPLALLAQKKPEEVQLDAAALATLDALLARRAHEAASPTWHDRAGRPLAGQVAYFSAEFGLHEGVPIYSGGLGILAGDHLKSASDLGIPLVAVGLLYREGYGRQHLDGEGRQVTWYPQTNFAELPLTRPLDAAGQPLQIEVPLAGQPCRVAVHLLQVGRVPLYLLDTDVPENPQPFREITARLYGGGIEGRIRQEVVLGIGGVRALAALGIEPVVFHLNEGHSAFLNLERLQRLRQSGQTPEAALAQVRATSVFTTHTPVEAGHDRFSPELTARYLAPWADDGIDALLALGRWPGEHDGLFNLTLLSFATCSRLNGVAALHGEVSRQMFHRYFGQVPEAEVPITHVTNGVHPPTWQAPELVDLVRTVLPEDFRERPSTDPVWQRVQAVDDAALWALRGQLKTRLIEHCRAREAGRRTRLGLPPWTDHLDPAALTLGFARRFAPYKRADLLFRDLDRLLAILAAAPGPVQILFAGKAHPADEPGRALVEAVHHYSTHAALQGRVLLVEDYDMELGRALTRGVDVWLNNPRRPKEASGTSGMKAAMNGVPNLSILDGWWPEAWDGTHGWAIGGTREFDTVEAQDDADADALYRLLEAQVIPLYYQRDPDGLPHAWLKRAKASIAACTPQFSSDRQVIDYVHHLYAAGTRP